ncbi:hypothetical protein LUZ63_001440 [Rhynchospora breviuscula]|uniref:Replication factor A C-terminal domain-containing protein n=1 Tax=Rhynchospora breviuscula TaxID=2022672 RepID=A0A9Q0CWV1_9POAL|nr:hypothetical protein LUZ63_001440 [Rhynchospora breviuscula]
MDPLIPIRTLTLTTDTENLTVHGRPVRIWPAADVRFGRVYNMSFVFIDHTGKTVQGTIPVSDYQRLSAVFAEQNLCSIARFTVDTSNIDYKVIKHPYVLSLTRQTLVTVLPPDLYAILRNYFDFASFKDIGVTITHLKAVMDVIARVVGFGDVHQRNSGPQPSRVQGMYLRDNSTPYDGNPITLRATSETYNIHTATSSALLWPDPIKMTIMQLNSLYLDSYNENHYQCAAIIMNINNRLDWNYESCPECHRKLGQNSGGMWCGHCNTRKTNGVPWYRIRVQVVDHTGSAQFVLLGRLGEVAVGMTAQALAAIQQQNNNKTPDQLMAAVGKKYLFTVAGKQRTPQQDNRTYTVVNIEEVPADMLELLPQPVLDSQVGNLASASVTPSGQNQPHTSPHPLTTTPESPPTPAQHLLTYHSAIEKVATSDDSTQDPRGKRPLAEEGDTIGATLKNVKRKLEFDDIPSGNIQRSANAIQQPLQLHLENKKHPHHHGHSLLPLYKFIFCCPTVSAQPHFVLQIIMGA